MDLKSRIENVGGKATVRPTDLSKPSEIELLINMLRELPGGVDIVVNNAGKSIMRPYMQSLDRLHDFIRLMAVNYSGPVQLLLGLTPVLKHTKGHIINVSAINVLLPPVAGWAAYQASKSAFDQWLGCAAPELKEAGIAISSIYLPLVRTRMIAPNPAYKHMPAMDPDDAALLVSQYMISRKQRFTPWWLVFGQIASFLFPQRWAWASMDLLKK